MPGELIAYRGLPGSGKTTRAKEDIATFGGSLVGRDHLRPLCGVTEAIGNRAQEDLVTKKQDQFIREGLRRGENVHVDDLNLRQKYLTRLWKIALQERAEFTVVDLTNTIPAVCVQQDQELARGRVVGETVIMDLYKRFIEGKAYPLPVGPKPTDVVLSGVYEPPSEDVYLSPVWIVDIDGTVAKMDGRGPHEYDKVSTDRPNGAVIDVVRALRASGDNILFLSGRPERCREATRFWLNKYVTTQAVGLFMRADGDFRDDSIVKRELFDLHIRYQFDVQGVIDDRDRVVEMWRGLGLTCLQVDYGSF